MAIKIPRAKKTALEKFQANPTPADKENYISIHCGRECGNCSRLNINGGECYGPKIKNPCLAFSQTHCKESTV